MLTGPAYNFDTILCRLRRNPVLTAMMVCSLVFGVSALIAGVKVWRVSSLCTIAQTPAPPNVVHVDIDVAGRSDLPMHSDSAFAREVVSACPCAASREWHWQPI
jgi:hypothetical protein